MTQPDKPKKPAPRSARRRSREFVLQGLYQWRVSGNDETAIEAHLRGSEGFDKADLAFFSSLLRGIFAQHEALTALLSPHLDRPFTELSPIEASILLLGAYELLHHPETPYRVIINEAIELSKGFGGTDGHRYVNGVLDKLALSLRELEVKHKQSR